MIMIMGKFKIILSDPPVVKNQRQRASFPSFGVLYLSAYIKKKVDNIEIYYLESFLTLDGHIDRIRKIQPHVYGISFASFIKEKSLITIKKVREEFETLKIIAGGAHPTIFPGECLHIGADFCVLGEGEETFAELLNTIFLNKKNYRDIPGIAYKGSDGEIVITQKRKLIENLDTLPFPDWDLCQEKKYTGHSISKGNPQWSIIVSRGCPFNCNFCSNPIWKHNIPWLRLRSPENIAEEVKLIYSKGYREIDLICDEFNPNLKWAKDVCQAIKNLRLTDLFFRTLLRAAPIDEELCSLLNDINCWSVNLGIESANERVLKGINKSITIDEVTRCLTYLKKYKIRTFGFFMMFNAWEKNGQPQFETLEEVNNTLSFAESLLKKKLLRNISWGFVSPIPGSDLYNTLIKHKLIHKDAYQVSKYRNTTIRIPGVPGKEKKKVKRRGGILKIKYTLKNDLANINIRDLRYLLSRARDYF